MKNYRSVIDFVSAEIKNRKSTLYFAVISIVGLTVWNIYMSHSSIPRMFIFGFLVSGLISVFIRNNSSRAVTMLVSYICIFTALWNSSFYTITDTIYYLLLVYSILLPSALTPIIAAFGYELLLFHSHAVEPDANLVNGNMFGIAMNAVTNAVAARFINLLIREQQAHTTAKVELQESLSKMEYMAYHDPVSGLANRRLLIKELESQIQYAQSSEQHFAVFYLDLDNFKDTNDTLGHAAGDALIATVGNRLKSICSSENVLSRQGGDEFTIMIKNVPTDHDAITRALRLIEETRKPIIIRGVTVEVSVSVGIALYPEHGEDPDALLKNADLAMYQAKFAGGNRYQVFDRSLGNRTIRRIAMENALKGALDRNEFYLCYQPKVDLKSGMISGVEALIRWNSSEFGLVNPSDFIEVAEKTGIILPIGEWVLRTACIQAKLWQTQYQVPLTVSVNISPEQVNNSDLVFHVRKVLDETNLPPGLLELEITETTAMHNLNHIRDVIKELRRDGIAVSLDDFGTGYSSLSYLSRLQFTSLKIDRQFIADVMLEETGASLLSAIITMGKRLNLQIVAEGVETLQQVNILRSLGCDIAQGFYISRPLLAEDIIPFIEGGPVIQGMTHSLN